MELPRRIRCDICGAIAEEATWGGGWPGWGSLDGASAKIHLCPPHLKEIIAAINGTQGEKGDHDGI